MTESFDPQAYWEQVNSARKDMQYLHEFYRDIAAKNYLTKEHEARGHQMRWMKRWIREHKWKSLLDAGCGPGFWFQLWSDLKRDATGVDRAENAVIRARAMIESLGKQYEVVQSPLSKLPFNDKQFDVAVTVKVLLHTPPDDIAPTLRELGRVAKHLMLLEMQGVRPIQTREHVFQHDYRKLFDDLGFTIRTDEVLPGNQQFMIVEPTGRTVSGWAKARQKLAEIFR